MAFLSTTFFLYLTTILVSIFTALYLFYRHKYSYWAKLGVIHEPGRNILGSISKSLTMKTSFADEIADFYKKYKALGVKYYGLYFFHKPVLGVNDPELLKCILLKDFQYFHDRGTFANEEDDPLSAHLFSLSGLKWKRLRQKLTPTFTSGKLKKMFSTLVDCTEGLENCLDDTIAKKEPVDIKKILIQYTTQVIGSCAFGIDCNSFKDPDSEFIKYGKFAFNPLLIDRIKLFFCSAFPKLGKFLRLRVTNKDLDIFFRKLVKDTIEYREKNGVHRRDFLDLLIQLKNKGEVEHDDDNDDDEIIEKNEEIGTTLTLNEAAAQCFIFFLAGFETSSTTMTFCLYELAKNPEIQEKTRKEIVKVLKEHDGQTTYEALKEMKYLEKVIQETLRIHPPAGNLNREVTKDYTLPDSDIILKKGSGVFISVQGLHMDPEYYPEPEKFDPERFSEEGKASRPDFTYLPFGDGPRICIGLRFAMLQTKVGLCRLLYNYRFTLNSKTQDPLVIDPATFVRSVKGGIWLNAEKISI